MILSGGELHNLQPQPFVGAIHELPLRKVGVRVDLHLN
jgi:hypothetical protein